MYANQVTDSFSFERRRDQMFYPWLARRHHDIYGFGKTAAAVARPATSRSRAKFIRSSAGGASTDPERKASTRPSPTRSTSTGSSRMAASSPQDFRFWIGEGSSPQRQAAGVRRGRLREAEADRGRAPGSDDHACGPRYEPVHHAGRITGRHRPLQRHRLPDPASATMLKRADSDAKKYPFIGYTTPSPCARTGSSGRSPARSTLRVCRGCSCSSPRATRDGLRGRAGRA